MRPFYFSRLIHSWFSQSTKRSPKPKSRRQLALERMEDRTTPATASLLGSTLTIDFTAASDQVSASFDGSLIQLTGSFASTPSPFTGVDRIVIQDSGNLSNQKMTFSGTTPFSLPDGLSSTGIETVIFNQAVDAGGGIAGISVTAPVSIAVRGNLTGGNAGVNLLANPTASGTSTYGILVENGATITTNNDGDTVLNGYSGNTGSGYRTGIILQGGGSVSAGGAGKVTVTGQGGLNSGPSNLGVSVADNSSIISAGGDITVRGTGGTGQGSGNIGIRLSSTAQIEAGGSGAVSLEGVGGTGSGTGNYGVSLTSNAKITSQCGSISVLATGTTGGSGAAGLSMEAKNLIDAGGGLVTLTSDSIDTSGAAIVSAGGKVAINPRSAGLPIGIGSADKLTGTLSLGLSSTELASISADSLAIGSANSGSITVYANATLPSVSDLYLSSGGSINASASTVVLSVASINLLAGTGIGNILVLKTASTGIVANSLAGLVNIANTNSGLTTANLSGSTVNFSTTGALDIAGNAITGDLSIQAQGDITQSGAFTVAGVATFGTASASDIILNLPNDFSSIGITGARDVVIRDTGTLILNASTIARNLSVFTGGNLTDNGNLAVSGTTTIDAGKFDILLDNSNNFGSLGITAANNAAITDTGAIDLAASTLAGTLAVTTKGAITQSGALSIAGAATLNAGSTNNITLSDPANDFSSVSIISANNVALSDANSLILATSTISGTLAVNTNGPITQSGILSVTGAATLGAGATNDITLNNPANNFFSVSITSANNVSLDDANALILGSSTVSGTLAVNTKGSITQSGIVSVAGASTFAAGANAITLTDSKNDFTGTVTITGGTTQITALNALTAILTTTGDTTLLAGGNLTVSGTVSGAGSDLSTTSTKSGTTSFGPTSVAGNFSVSSAGAVGQTGSLSISGSSNINAGANAITLTDSKNDFTGTVTITGGNTQITALNALTAILTTTGDTTLIAGGNLTVSGTVSGAGSDLSTTSTKSGTTSFGTTSVAGNLSVSSAGAVGQTGSLSISGSSNINAGANAITLTDSNNDFTGTVTITGGTTQITDLNALTAILTTTGDTTLLAGGNLTVSGTVSGAGSDLSTTSTKSGTTSFGTTSVAGNLSVSSASAVGQTGILSISGAATFNAGSTNDITLNNPANNFSSVSVSSARNVALNDINALVLAASTIDGNLDVTTGGDITDTGSITVAGVTTLSAAGHDITLDNNNDFNSLGITAAKNATINDINALALNACAVTGNLTITADGDLTDNGPITVGGTASFNAGPGHDLILDNANSFGSLAIPGARNATLNTTGALALEACTISGNLTITTGGDLTDNGPISVAGFTKLTAAGHDITLDNNNDFNSLAITAANNATIRDTSALALDTSTITGNLTITTGGDLTQSGSLTIGGATTLNTGGHDITLGNANEFNSLGITSARDVIVNDTTALILNASTITGTLTITTGGDLTDSGALVVSGLATLDTGSHDITLDNANNFNSLGITKAANALLNDTTGLVINGISVTGNLTISASGTITQTDVVTVSGTSSFSAGAAGDITLDYANDFNSISFPTGRNVDVLDVNSLVFGGSVISGALNVLANDAITQSSGIRVTGAASLTTGSIISLNQANDFSSVEFFAGDDVTVNDINSIEIRESLVSGAFEVTAAGSISSSRALIVAGTATFTSTAAGNILVTRLSCQGLVNANTFQGDATIVNSDQILFSGSVNGKYSLKALSGGISDFGVVSATGGITLQAPGDSHLDQDLSGPGGLTFHGSGTLNVSGQNTFTGPTVLSAGTIVLTGSLASSPVAVSGGLLTGSGSLKSLSVTGGTVTPDLTFDCAPLSLGRAGRLVMQVGGIVPGVNQALVTASSVALSGKLVIAGNPAFQTVMGSRITLINNTGASKVSGQFAGLPEGTQVLVNGMRYFISYRGGAGRNDVVLNRPTIVAASVSNRLITVFDKDGRPRGSILPFGNYLGKATISTGDVTGDGVPDVLTGSGVGNRPHVRVFNGVNLGGVYSFYALEPSYMGDVAVAAGDINQDGKADIIAAAGPGDPGLVRVYSGNDLSVLKSFFPFGPGFTGGVTVATGDFNQDGVADIVCGTDGRSITTVRIFDGSTGNILRNWRPFPAFSVGVSLAVGDFNGDGRLDVFAGAKAGVNPVVAIMNGANGKTIAAFNAFDANYRNGVSVVAIDINGDGKDEVVATPLGVNFQPVVRIIARAGLRTLRQFTAFQQPGGASVAGWN